MPATAQKDTADTGEKPAGVELLGRDLIAWKLAYHAAERSVMPSPLGASQGAKTTVVPELPRRRLMELTPTGDRKFTFGVEFHDPSQRKDYWELFVVTVLVVDLETSMRERIVDCSTLLATQKTLDDYAKQFGDTDGVRAFRADVAPSIPVTHGIQAHTEHHNAQWEGKVVQGDVRNNVYFIHKGTRYYVAKWDYVTPFGLWGDSRMLKVNQGELDALPEGHAIDSIDEMKRCLAR